ncbi:MAG: hypothetical protein JXM69_12645 [Anaerolineae bacterium]|nr:hypothetical protein [Anaerolineae bacterium]
MKPYVAFSIGLAAASLAIGYGLPSLWLGVTGVAALGLLWLTALWRNWPSMTTPLAVCFIGLTTYGTWQGVAIGWLLFSLVATLAAWDLAQFTHRLQGVGQIEEKARLQRTHLQRLLVVAGLGLLAGGVALSFQIKLDLGWIILLGLLTVIGLGRVIARLQRESD